MSTPPQSSPPSLYVGRSKYPSIIVGCRLASSSSSSFKSYPNFWLPNDVRRPSVLLSSSFQLFIPSSPSFLTHSTRPPRLSHHPFPIQVERIMGICYLQWIQCHAHVFINRQMNIITFLLHIQMRDVGSSRPKLRGLTTFNKFTSYRISCAATNLGHQPTGDRQLDEDSSFQKSSSIRPLHERVSISLCRCFILPSISLKANRVKQILRSRSSRLLTPEIV